MIRSSIKLNPLYGAKFTDDSKNHFLCFLSRCFLDNRILSVQRDSNECYKITGIEPNKSDAWWVSFDGYDSVEIITYHKREELDTLANWAAFQFELKIVELEK